MFLGIARAAARVVAALPVCQVVGYAAIKSVVGTAEEIEVVHMPIIALTKEPVPRLRHANAWLRSGQNKNTACVAVFLFW